MKSATRAAAAIGLLATTFLVLVPLGITGVVIVSIVRRFRGMDSP